MSSGAGHASSSSSSSRSHHFFGLLTRLKTVNTQKPKILPPNPSVVRIVPSTSTTSDIHLPVRTISDAEPQQQQQQQHQDSPPEPAPTATLEHSQEARLLTAIPEMSLHSVSSRTPSPAFSNRAGSNTYEDEYTQEPRRPEEYAEPAPFSNDSSGDEREVARGAYDLKAPPPTAPLSNIELLTQRLFSVDHLRLILRDKVLGAQFQSFLAKYRPQSIPVLEKYLNTLKVLSAVEYANAVARSLSSSSNVISLDSSSFDPLARAAVEHLVNDSLTGFVTHKMTILVTELLVKEITGQNTPIMRDLVQGLAEVYCLTDPSLPDNPIVYASEEFYNATQYGMDYVIGRNCRFLQGPKSSGATVQRLVDALVQGQEVCETILNYRRDGSPFVNLLLIAPLYDNKGIVRYFIGAQIDINGLIEGGHGLDSFERLLAEDRGNARFGDSSSGKSPQQALSKLSSYWNQDEVDTVTKHMQVKGVSGTSGKSTPVLGRSTGRRVLGMSDSDDKNLWPELHLGPSGRLPGVFQNYLLVRPSPSLRITFTSPALRHPGLLQASFLDCVVGPASVRQGLIDSLNEGVGVTAKITWLMPSAAPESSPRSEASSNPGSALKRHRRLSVDMLSDGGSTVIPDHRRPAHAHAHTHAPSTPQARWIHCTPLLGSDAKVGVWMIVMVESEAITGTLHPSPPMPGMQPAPSTASNTRAQQQQQQQHSRRVDSAISSRHPAHQQQRVPPPPTSRIRPDGDSTGTARIPSPTPPASANRLYAEYLRLQSQNHGSQSGSSSVGAKSRAAAAPTATNGLHGVVPGRYVSSGSANAATASGGGGGGVARTTTTHARNGEGDEFKDF